MDIASLIRLSGGLAPTHQLLRRGVTPRSLAAAARAGSIVRVRQGWYSVPDAADAYLRAWRVGGVLTCHRGAAAHGLRVVDDDATHVLVGRNASRLRTPDDLRRRRQPDDAVTVHWRSPLTAGPRFLASPLDCLVDLIGCEDERLVIAAADSAVRLGLVSAARWKAVVHALPARHRAVAAVDRRSESLPESVVRYELAMLGVRPQLQVTLLPGIRVDLLLGRRLVVEVDGREFHAGPEAFARDRRRDARLRAAGFRILRFSYAQVIFEWPSVRAAILAALDAGDHL